jgi:hypothetical protein
LDELLRLVEDLYRRYGNVYCSVTLYSQRQRPRKYKDTLPESERSVPLPGRFIFVDDLAQGECSYIIRSGTGNPQAILLLDAPADAETRHNLAVRAAVACGGDPSGADRVQIMRIPGTINTKRRHGGQYAGPDWIPGTGYQVRLEEGSGRTYSLEELQSRFPAVAQVSGTFCNEMSDTLRAKVDHWRKHAKELLASPRLRAAQSKPDGQLARVLRGERVTIQWNKGYRDSSVAAQRAVLADKLVFFGFPDEEVLAMVLESEWWDPDKNMDAAAMEQDALAVLQHARQKYPHRVPEPTRWVGGNVPRPPQRALPRPSTPPPDQATAALAGAAAAPNPQPPIPNPTPTPGHPVALTPAEYLSRLGEASQGRNANGQLIVLWTQQMAADELGVSKSTIERCERVLRNQGRIRREVVRRGRNTTSWVVILSIVTTTGTKQADQRGAVSSESELLEESQGGMFPQGASDETERAEPDQTTAAPEPELGTSTAPEAAEGAGNSSAPIPQPQSLIDLMRDAIDAHGPGLPPARRYIAANGGGRIWHPDAIRRAYDAEIQRRKYARNEAQVVAQARAMSWSELKRRATNAGQYAAELRRRGNRRWSYWNWYCGQLEAEITRRTELGRSRASDPPSDGDADS